LERQHQVTGGSRLCGRASDEHAGKWEQREQREQWQ
jgi:hypothetical protein